MFSELKLPDKPDNISENLTGRRLAAIAAIEDYTHVATNPETPLALNLYAIIYRFWPAILKDFEVPSLRNFIEGYSNDHIVIHALKQLEKSAAILYGVEIYQESDPILKGMYLSARERSAQILNVLCKWLRAQNDEQAVQIAELDELTAQDFKESLGWNLAANFHLFDIMRDRTAKPKPVEFQGMSYDLNFTSDKIHRVSNIFAYMMWKEGKVNLLEIFMAYYASPIEYNAFIAKWWEERPELAAEQKRLEEDDFAEAYARGKTILFHQSICLYLQVIKLMQNPVFIAQWQNKFLSGLDPSVLQTFGPIQAREMLKSLFDGLLGESCSEEMIDDVLAEIKRAKGSEG